MRVPVFCIVATFAAALCCGRALALTEYCPAALSIVPHTDPSPAPGATYAPSDLYDVTLTAVTSRSVSGTIAVHTTTGWFSAPFSSIPLYEVAERWRSPSAEYTRHSYDSEMIRMQFPQAVSILSAFVSEAQTKGETVLGWDALGKRPCAGNADKPLARRPLDKAARGLLSSTFVTPPVEQSPLPTLVAASSNAPGSTDCEKPFAEATVVEAASPTYPRTIGQFDQQSGVTLVQVAISATGRLDDAWIFGPSGNPQFDDSALSAAKRSRYSPRRSFCANVPGTYLFRAEFRL